MKQLWFRNSVQKVFSPTSLKLTTSIESLHYLVMRNRGWYPSDSSHVQNPPKIPNTIAQGRLQSWELGQSSSGRLTHSERGRGRKQNYIKTLSHITLKTVPWLQPCLTLIIMRCSWYILLGPQKFDRFFTEFQNSDQISFASMCHFGCLIQLHVAIFCFLSVGIWPPQSHLRPRICNTLATLHQSMKWVKNGNGL